MAAMFIIVNNTTFYVKILFSKISLIIFLNISLNNINVVFILEDYKRIANKYM
jgi:hypothetical protein